MALENFDAINAPLYFLKLPTSIGIKYPHSKKYYYLRPFGIYREDMDIDFISQVRPKLVTQILKSCTRDSTGTSIDENFFWDISIGKRIECLLSILQASSLNQYNSSAGLLITLQCSNDACKKKMEVELSIEELTNLQHRSDHDEKIDLEISGMQVRFRKPVGQDQLRLLERADTSNSVAETTLIQWLVKKEDETDPKDYESMLSSQESRHRIDAAMSEFDPLIDFGIVVACPNCMNEDRYELDLEGIALQKLRIIQNGMVNLIHQIAIHYHWNEDQIFSIPHWRRLQYLSLINRDDEQQP